MEPSIRGLKHVLPFRLGTTSYIIPDDILPNVRYLADKVDDIELVLFESKTASNLPDPKVVDALKILGEKNGLSYTIHLPIDIHTGHVDESVRQHSVERCRYIIELVKPLLPLAYILHLDGDQRGTVPSKDISRWLTNHRRSVHEILEAVEPEKICIETLDYPFELVEEIVQSLGLSVCIDIGHLLVSDENIESFLGRYLAKTRVIHLHGVQNGKDHKAIHHLDPSLLEQLFKRFARKNEANCVMTLEIFNEKDFQASLNTIACLLQKDLQPVAKRRVSE